MEYNRHLCHCPALSHITCEVGSELYLCCVANDRHWAELGHRPDAQAVVGPRLQAGGIEFSGRGCWDRHIVQNISIFSEHGQLVVGHPRAPRVGGWVPCDVGMCCSHGDRQVAWK